jgi:hypothetical protein
MLAVSLGLRQAAVVYRSPQAASGVCVARVILTCFEAYAQGGAVSHVCAAHKHLVCNQFSGLMALPWWLCTRRGHNCYNNCDMAAVYCARTCVVAVLCGPLLPWGTCMAGGTTLYTALIVRQAQWVVLGCRVFAW